MRCPKCQRTVSDNAAFCNNCGTKIEKSNTDAAPQSVCGNCGSPISPTAAFCNICGAKAYEEPHSAEADKRSVKPAKKRITGILIAVIICIVACGGIVAGMYIYPYLNPTDYEDDDSERIAEKDDEKADSEDTSDDGNILAEEDEDIVNTEDEEAVDESDDNIYLFPSDKEYITARDLDGKTQEEVAMIRNEIFARHGYIFQTEPYKSYFSAQKWYVPDESFDDSCFNAVETANKEFLIKYEESRGWR